MKKIYMLNLSFELTRRCNLNCRWCARGNPQNVDITQEIIDKTLDETKSFNFLTIQFTGGEPQMNPDMILYLAQQIVKRKIKVQQIRLQTNGTIKNDKVKEALMTLSDYFESAKNQSWLEDIKKFAKAEVMNFYPNTIDKNIAIIVSTDEHDNKNTIDDICRFYDIGRDNCIVQKQTEHKNHKNKIIMIEGRAAEKYLLFTKDELKNIRIMYNKYCIIKDDYIESDKIAISKTLTVSSNGNVFVGAMTSYDNVDKCPMFNIMDCKNDFYKRVNEWCWQNPISSMANDYIERYLSLQWQKTHEIPIDAQEEHTFSTMAERIKILADKIKEYHHKFLYLKHWEVNLLAICSICLNTYNANEHFALLSICGLFDNDTIKTIDRTTLKNMFNTLIARNYKRRNSKKFT